MRTIDLTGATNVELWPGRRLYAPDRQLLVSLPRGGLYAVGKSLSFGSATKTSVVIRGSAELVEALLTAIVLSERPDDDKVVKL